MEIIRKIENKTANIGIIGLGYVGLPLGLEFAHKGFSVTGFDIDERKIPILNSGKSYIKHIPEERIKKFVDNKKFSATSDFSKLTDCDSTEHLSSLVDIKSNKESYHKKPRTYALFEFYQLFLCLKLHNFIYDK